MFEPYINLRNDIIFKIVFGYKKNEKILIFLLNAILNLEVYKKIKGSDMPWHVTTI